MQRNAERSSEIGWDKVHDANVCYLSVLTGAWVTQRFPLEANSVEYMEILYFNVFKSYFTKFCCNYQYKIIETTCNIFAICKFRIISK